MARQRCLLHLRCITLAADICIFSELRRQPNIFPTLVQHIIKPDYTAEQHIPLKKKLPHSSTSRGCCVQMQAAPPIFGPLTHTGAASMLCYISQQDPNELGEIIGSLLMYRRAPLLPSAPTWLRRARRMPLGFMAALIVRTHAAAAANGQRTCRAGWHSWPAAAAAAAAAAAGTSRRG